MYHTRVCLYFTEIFIWKDEEGTFNSMVIIYILYDTKLTISYEKNDEGLYIDEVGYTFCMKG